jgi:hypothetical protein
MQDHHDHHGNPINNRYPRLVQVDSKQVLSKAQELDQWSGWGWAGFIGQMAIAFGLLIFGFTHYAFASKDGSENIRPAFTQGIPVSSWIEAQGDIGWKDGAPQIKDAKSGKIYKLVNTTGLRQLYDSGVKSVAVAGNLKNDSTIEVESMSLP